MGWWCQGFDLSLTVIKECRFYARHNQLPTGAAESQSAIASSVSLTRIKPETLDRASALRTKIMEKGDRLTAVDVQTHLCVMVLMLQSGNRENRETLRMFRDRGDVHDFFPPEG